MQKYLNLRTYIAQWLIFAFLANTVGPIPAQAGAFVLPKPGQMVHLSPSINPPILKGLKVYPNEPFKFDFILDQGDESNHPDLKQESTKLIKYFLASLTIPENDLWVNLSPYEKDRIIPNSFGLTEMGLDLLAEDYMLKQITASLIYPEDEIGKKFWKRIYAQAVQKYGTTDIPVNTFNKVWIVPEKAVVYENPKAGTAYVVDAKLKVMLEEDYRSLMKHQPPTSQALNAKATNDPLNPTHKLASDIIREIIIPELTKEVNQGQNFAQLRQVYNSLILAAWYKKKIKDSILSQVYADRNKITGINIDDPRDKERIYHQYLKAFKRGVFNYIQDNIDPATQQPIPTKYFSGGFTALPLDHAMTISTLQPQEKPGLLDVSANLAMAPATAVQGHVEARFDQAMTEQSVMLPDAPRWQKDDIKFKTMETWGNSLEYDIADKVYKFAEKNQLIIHLSNSDVHGLRVLLENLAQHEYNRPPLYYRIFRSSEPSDGVRLEFWGPGKHPLPQKLKGTKMNGEGFHWFSKKEPPWETLKAPRHTITGGMVHIGVSVIFNSFDDSIKVGWREDENTGGHIIAVHFTVQPVNMGKSKKVKNTAQKTGNSVQWKALSSRNSSQAMTADFQAPKLRPVKDDQAFNRFMRTELIKLSVIFRGLPLSLKDTGNLEPVDTGVFEPLFQEILWLAARDEMVGLVDEDKIRAMIGQYRGEGKVSWYKVLKVFFQLNKGLARMGWIVSVSDPQDIGWERIKRYAVKADPNSGEEGIFAVLSAASVRHRKIGIRLIPENEAFYLEPGYIFLDRYRAVDYWRDWRIFSNIQAGDIEDNANSNLIKALNNMRYLDKDEYIRIRQRLTYLEEWNHLLDLNRLRRAMEERPGLSSVKRAEIIFSTEPSNALINTAIGSLMYFIRYMDRQYPGKLSDSNADELSLELNAYCRKVFYAQTPQQLQVALAQAAEAILGDSEDNYLNYKLPVEFLFGALDAVINPAGHADDPSQYGFLNDPQLFEKIRAVMQQPQPGPSSGNYAMTATGDNAQLEDQDLAMNSSTKADLETMRREFRQLFSEMNARGLSVDERLLNKLDITYQTLKSLDPNQPITNQPIEKLRRLQMYKIFYFMANKVKVNANTLLEAYFQDCVNLMLPKNGASDFKENREGVHVSVNRRRAKELLLYEFRKSALVQKWLIDKFETGAQRFRKATAAGKKARERFKASIRAHINSIASQVQLAVGSGIGMGPNLWKWFTFSHKTNASSAQQEFNPDTGEAKGQEQGRPSKSRNGKKSNGGSDQRAIALPNEQTLRIMALKSKDVETLIGNLSLNTGLSKEAVNGALLEAAASKSIPGVQEYFLYLNREVGNRGQNISNNGSSENKPVRLPSIFMYPGTFFIAKNWEINKEEMIAELNDYFSDENIDATERQNMYRRYPGIYRIKMRVGGKVQYSLYVKYFKDTKILVIIGFNSQRVFHGKDERMWPEFLRYMEKINQYSSYKSLIESSKGKQLEQLQAAQDQAQLSATAHPTAHQDYLPNYNFGKVILRFIADKRETRLSGAQENVFPRTADRMISNFILEGIGLAPGRAREIGFDKLLMLWNQYWRIGDEILEKYGKLFSMEELEAMLKASGDGFPVITNESLAQKGITDEELRQFDVKTVSKTDPRNRAGILEQFNQKAGTLIAQMPLTPDQKLKIKQAFVANSRSFFKSYILERKYGLYPTPEQMIEIFQVKDSFTALIDLREIFAPHTNPEEISQFKALLLNLCIFCQTVDDYVDLEDDYNVQPNIILAVAKARYPNEYKKLEGYLKNKRSLGMGGWRLLIGSIPNTNRDVISMAYPYFKKIFTSKPLSWTVLASFGVYKLFASKFRSSKIGDNLPLSENPNQAMNAKGGIDLTAGQTPLEIKNPGQSIQFHLDPATLQQLQNAPGFVPVIINIQPLTNLRAFLGVPDQQPA